MKEFDENEALRYIRRELAEVTDNQYTDDDLLNIVDMIWDYYEMNGLLDVDNDDDDDMTQDELVNELTDYAARMLRKDKACKIDPAHLDSIIRGELTYENKLDEEMFK